MNERAKTGVRRYLFGFVIGFVLAGAGIGLFCLANRLTDAGGITELDKGSQREAARAVKGLGRTVERLGAGINAVEGAGDAIEASGERLAEHIGNAGRISGELGISADAMGDYLRSAVEIYQRIESQKQALDCIPGCGCSGGGGPGDMGGDSAARGGQ